MFRWPGRASRPVPPTSDMGALGAMLGHFSQFLAFFSYFFGSLSHHGNFYRFFSGFHRFSEDFGRISEGFREDFSMIFRIFFESGDLQNSCAHAVFRKGRALEKQ